jgi:hypothetical protein
MSLWSKARRTRMHCLLGDLACTKTWRTTEQSSLCCCPAPTLPPHVCLDLAETSGSIANSPRHRSLRETCVRTGANFDKITRWIRAEWRLPLQASVTVAP